MPVYVDPQGQKFEVPADPTAEEAAVIRSMKLRPDGMSPGAHMVRDVARSGFAGGVQGMLRAPLVLGDLNKLALHGINKISPGAIKEEDVNRWGSQGWIDAFRDSPQDRWLKDKLGVSLTHEPETPAGRYAAPTMGAVTGAATMGGIGAAPGVMPSGAQGLNAARIALSPSSAAINAASGAGGEAAYDISRGFDESKQGNPLAPLVGSVGTAAVGNLVKQIAAPNLNQIIYNATRGMKDANWKETAKDLETFRKSGSKSYTLADLPQLQARVGGLARGMSNTSGGDLLQQKLSLQHRMNDDIPGLLRNVGDDIFDQTFDPRELAEVLASKGSQKIKDAVKVRSTAMAGNLNAAGNVNEADLLANTNATVGKLLRLPGNQAVGQVKALRSAEDALLGKSKAPTYSMVTPANLNVKSLSQQVKGLRKVPSGESDSPGTLVSRSQQMLAADAAQDALERSSPRFKTAMQQYKTTTEGLIAPLERGLPGQIKDVSDAEGVLAALRKVPLHKLQAEINTLGLTDKEVLQIAKMLTGKLKVMPNMTKAAEGNKLDREVLDSLTDFVNPDLAAKVGKKLDVADSLSRLSSEHSTDRLVNLNLSKNPISTLVNPFGTGSMRAGLRTTEKEVGKLSDLLGNPTPENLAKLREMSKFDPRAKRALEWISSLMGAAGSSQINQRP